MTMETASPVYHLRYNHLGDVLAVIPAESSRGSIGCEPRDSVISRLQSLSDVTMYRLLLRLFVTILRRKVWTR
jgi:hypothetical protein